MKRARFFGVRSLTLIAVALAVCAGCNGDGAVGGTGGQQTIQANLAPFFQGVGSVTTAGGDRVLVTWRPASDDHDAVSDIRYRVYLSGTSDGFDFAAPVVTTTPGVERVQLSAADSSLINVGQEVFVAVRAMDTNDAEDLNQVECAVACMNAGTVAYVVPGSLLTGTVGNPLDPYTSVQAAVSAIGSGGGIVLVAGGLYNEIVSLSDQGDTGSRIAVYGSFDAADFTAGTTPQQLLAGNNFALHPTVLDGQGLSPSGDDLGHFNVRNNGRRTYVGRFMFRDDEDEPLFGAYSVNLVLSGSEFLDPVKQETEIGPSEAILVQEENTDVTKPSLDVVGCEFSDIDRFDGGETAVAIGVFAPMYRLRVGSCMAWDGGYFLYAYPEKAQYPGFDFAYEGNWVTRHESSPLYLDMGTYEGTDNGDVTVRVAGNRLTAVEERIYMGRLGERATNSKMDVLFERNFIGPVYDYGIEIDWLHYSDIGSMTVGASQFTFTVRDTAVVQTDSEALSFNYFQPRAGADVKVTVENSQFVQSDSETIYAYPGYNQTTPTFSQDGVKMKTVVRDITNIGTDGFFDWRQPLFRNGESTISVEGSLIEGVTGYGIDTEIYQFMTDVSSYGDETAKSEIHITDNIITLGYDYPGAYVSMEVYGKSVFEMRRNALETGEYGLEFSVYFPQRSVIAQNGGDPPNGGGGGGGETPLLGDLEFFIEGNVIENSYDYEALYIDIYGQPWVGGEPPTVQPTGRVYGSISNNRIRTGAYPLYFYSYAPVEGQLLVAYNTFLAAVEGESVEFDTHYGEWSVLFARNLVLGGGDDGEQAFDIYPCDCNRSSEIVMRNNLVAYSGGGIDFNGGIHTGQILNNTVAFTGQDEYDVPIGSDQDVFSPVHVENCVTHANQLWDVPEETIPYFTCFGYAAGGGGYGCIESDPVFMRHGDPTKANEWFQLADNSPAKDAGNPDPDFNDPDGTRNDLGAFGGPGAGPVGFLETVTEELPFLMIGTDPKVDLYAGVHMISGSTPVTLTFNHDVDPATANAANVAFLVSGTALAGNYAVDGRRVTFTPTVTWPAGGEVHLVVSTALQTLSGEPLDFVHARWFAIQPAQMTAEVEENNNPETAQVLPELSKIYAIDGGLSSAFDQDFFRINGLAGMRLQASLFVHREGWSGNFGLRLWAADGTTIIFENHRSMPDEDAFLDFTMPVSGVYYVEVFNISSGFEEPRPYRLEMWKFQR